MTREGYDMEDATRRFTAIDNRNETREILSSVYDSLKVKGYNPISGGRAELAPWDAFVLAIL